MNNAVPFWSARAGLRICSNTSGFMSAYSSITKNFNDTPLIVSGLSDPFRDMVAPLISFICKLFMWLLVITGWPSSKSVCHIMSLACPCVGAT